MLRVSIAALISILLFSTDPSVGAVCQVAALVMLVAAAGIGILEGRFRGAPPTLFEAVMLAMIALSLGAYLATSDGYSALYSMTFLVTILTLGVLVRCVSFEDVNQAAAWSSLFMLVLVALFQHDDWIAALTAEAGERWAHRFTPFGLHPDLAGIIFGSCAIISAVTGMATKTRLRLLWLAAVPLHLSILLAASARGALIACLIALGIGVSMRMRAVSARGRAILAFGVSTAALYAALNIAWITNFVTNMLELDSVSRGLGSGGTGRLDLWQTGWALVFSRDWELLLGSGLRTADPEHIGFWTENSYITIALESGVIAFCAFLYLLCDSIGRLVAHHRAPDKEQSQHYLLPLALMIYMAIESLSNRYLLAIGNPASLLFLIVSARASLPDAFTPPAACRAPADGAAAGSDHRG